jgi:Tfp pilus assembly PilM family ATPase
MKGLDLINPARIYIEIGQSSLKALSGSVAIETSLERQESGRLSDSCRAKVVAGLKGLLQNKGLVARPRAVCALGARGVSLRRVSLPAAGKEDMSRLLLLQIESEFPLPPEQLAWGSWPVDPGAARGNGAASRQELIIAAVKKEVVQEYADILAECGAAVEFTLAGLARNSVCPGATASRAMLDIGRDSSELLTFDNGAPAAARVLPWGGEDITRAIATALGVSRDEAETIKLGLSTSTGNDSRGKTGAAVDAALDDLAAATRQFWTGQKLYLSGKSVRMNGFAARFAARLGGGAVCEPIGVSDDGNASAAILGLKKAVENDGGALPMSIQVAQTRRAEAPARPAPLRWAVASAVLLLVVLGLPYVEAVLAKPFLAGKLASMRKEAQSLPVIDRELEFMQFLNQNQAPYLDGLLAFAKTTPPGNRFESLTMNRRGDIGLRLKFRDPQQIIEFRQKLLDSGFFATAVIEEQTPMPDRSINVRLGLQWKPSGSRKAPIVDLPAATNDAGKSAAAPAKPEARPKTGPAPGASPAAAPEKKH